MRSHDALACLFSDCIISHMPLQIESCEHVDHVIRWGHMWITCDQVGSHVDHVIRWGHMWITWSGGVTCGSHVIRWGHMWITCDQVGPHVDHVIRWGHMWITCDQVGLHVDHMWSGGVTCGSHVSMWVPLVLCPARTRLPARNSSGEQSRISWAHYPKRVMTNEIARSVIIT